MLWMLELIMDAWLLYTYLGWMFWNDRLVYCYWCQPGAISFIFHFLNISKKERKPWPLVGFFFFIIKNV